jgi:hypothetical protein
MPKFQAHVSGLELWSKCGIAFENRYLLGMKTPPNASLVVGIAVDASVNSDLQNKKDTAVLLPKEQVMETARDAVVAEWQNGVEVNEEDREEGVASSRDGAIDASVSLAGFHHDNVAPNLFEGLPAESCHVQRRWVLDIDGMPIQLAGTIDI